MKVAVGLPNGATVIDIADADDLKAQLVELAQKHISPKAKHAHSGTVRWLNKEPQVRIPFTFTERDLDDLNFKMDEDFVITMDDGDLGVIEGEIAVIIRVPDYAQLEGYL